MRPLRATAKMMKAERDDIPREVPGLYGGPYRRYCQFARCRVEDGILRVALFFPDNLHTGGRRPSYEVFIDRAAEKYITYDRMADKWRTARLDNLDWPRHIRYTDGTWMSPADTKMVQRYLGGDRGGYYGVLDYQEKLLEERLERRHKKVTDAWDADLSPTRPVPKDWDRWVAKVGVPENYIFYQYKRGGAKTGWCSYCKRDVPIKGPHHNDAGRCPRCRKTVTFKSTGRAGTVQTKRRVIYLMQRCKDGFVIRQFNAALPTTAVNTQSPTYAAMRFDVPFTTVRRARCGPIIGDFTSRKICAGSFAGHALPTGGAAQMAGSMAGRCLTCPGAVWAERVCWNISNGEGPLTRKSIWLSWQKYLSWSSCPKLACPNSPINVSATTEMSNTD